MGKETIADLCERLRKSGELDCLSIAHEWGPNCVNVSDCDACQKAVYDSIADRIEAAHEREMDRRCGKSPDGLPAGLTISPDGTLLDWEGESYVLRSIVRDVEREPNGNMAGDGKCHVTQYDTGDAEDTREKLEADASEFIGEVWADGYEAGGGDLMEQEEEPLPKLLKLLDRQAAITERDVSMQATHTYDKALDIERGYVEFMRKKRDELQAQVDALESENDRLKVKVSNQRRELDTYQIMYDVEAVAQLKREKKKYKGMYNAEHQMACSQRRKIDRLAEENEVMRQALRDLGDILG